MFNCSFSFGKGWLCLKIRHVFPVGLKPACFLDPQEDTLALGEMSPLRGTYESGVPANMKSQVQASQGAPQPHSQGDSHVSCGRGQQREGTATSRVRHGCRLHPRQQCGNSK